MLSNEIRTSSRRGIHPGVLTLITRRFAVATVEEKLIYPIRQVTSTKSWKDNPVFQVNLTKCNSLKLFPSRTSIEFNRSVFNPKFLGDQESDHERPVVPALIKAQHPYHVYEKPFYFMDYLGAHRDYFHFYFDYYPEIAAFQEFIKSKDNDYYLSKYSAADLKHYLKLFHQECMNDGIIPPNNMRHYRNMCKRLLKLLDDDPNIARNMALITSEIEFSEQIISLFEDKLDYVIDIVKYYYIKYDSFNDIQTFEELVQKLETELKKIQQFLRSHHTVDSTWFKNSVAKVQLVKFIEILDKHNRYNTIVLRHILQHPYLDKYIHFLDCQSGHTWYDVGHSNTHFVNLLLFMNLIPDINDFYKSASKLYSLAHDSSQSSVIRHAVNEVLSEWGSYVVSSREYNQGLQVHHPDIHVVSKDSMTNYVFSSLLHIGVPLEKYIADAGIANLPEKLGDCFDLMSLHYADGIHYMLAHLQKQDFITMFSDATILDKYLKLRLDNASELENSSFKVAQDDPYLQHYIAN